MNPLFDIFDNVCGVDIPCSRNMGECEGLRGEPNPGEERQTSPNRTETQPNPTLSERQLTLRRWQQKKRDKAKRLSVC